MSDLIPQRFTGRELQQARNAGLVRPPRLKEIFGSTWNWFSTFRIGPFSTFWRVGTNSKPPVNAAESDSGLIVTPESALTLSAVWACVWLISKTIATLPLELKRYGSDGAGVLDEDNPLFEVLRWQANSRMTAVRFWTFMWASMLLWGTGYAVKVCDKLGRVIALEPLLPQYITPFITPSGELRFSDASPTAPMRVRENGWAASEIFRLMDKTLDGLTGCSVIEFARHSMGIAQAGESSAGATFRNGLQAGGFLEVDKFLRPEQRDEFRAEISSFSGQTGTKKGGIMVLEGGVKFSELTMKPMDAQLLASRQFSVEDIARWFNMSPMLIGHSSGVSVWGSGLEQVFGALNRLTLRPLMVVAQQEIRHSLVPLIDRRVLYAEYDLDELLAADSAARAGFYSQMTQNGIYTRNECREKEGRGKMDGGDVLTVQSSLIPLSRMEASATDPVAQASEQVRTALLNFLKVEQVP